MGWRINLVKNDLPLSPELEAEINSMKESQSGISTRNGLIYFNPSHMEWMDYMWWEDVQDVLARHKANGEVLFSSSDGDNAGQAWGYRFTDGVPTKLVRNADGEWIVDDGEDHSLKPTGGRPASLTEAARGDTVAVAVIAYGMTSYEEDTVGDILPDGTLVVSGREFKAPSFASRGDMGFNFRLVPIDAPEVELE